MIPAICGVSAIAVTASTIVYPRPALLLWNFSMDVAIWFVGVVIMIIDWSGFGL